MKYINIYIILICIIYIIYIIYLHTLKEQFTVVGYNTSQLPSYTIDNLFNIEIKKIQTKLLKASIDKTISVDSSYILYNNNLTFPFTDQFIILIQDFLKTNLTSDKLQISKPTNIYWKDSLGNQSFIFNINILNTVHFTSRNLIVKVIIKNNTLFISNISLAKDNFAKFTIPGVDSYYPQEYQIQNGLFLLDPFYTSGYDMIITKDMKLNFDKSLHPTSKISNINE